VGLIGILVMVNFDYDATGKLQFVVDKSWIPIINSRYIVGVDGISLPLIALTLLVVPLCIIYSWNHFPEPRNPKAFLILILILETGMIGSFIAQDLILFFVFFEVVLLPMYFLIGVWGGEKRQYASNSSSTPCSVRPS
jgi:NADH-quinone oxidoreductase subunit M